MDSLYIILDFINYGYIYAILDGLACISIISAITIITLKNPIISVLFLIILFITVSCYLICSNITFLGLAYILVYVGAVSMLFLFILMLINIRVSELVSETKNNIPLVLIVSIIFYNAHKILFPQDTQDFFSTFWTKDGLFIVMHNNWENILIVFNNIVSIGNILYSIYAIFILIVSIILLLAMVGAIAITVRQSSSVTSKGCNISTGKIKIWKVIIKSFYVKKIINIVKTIILWSGIRKIVKIFFIALAFRILVGVLVSIVSIIYPSGLINEFLDSLYWLGIGLGILCEAQVLSMPLKILDLYFSNGSSDLGSGSGSDSNDSSDFSVSGADKDPGELIRDDSEDENGLTEADVHYLKEKMVEGQVNEDNIREYLKKVSEGKDSNIEERHQAAVEVELAVMARTIPAEQLSDQVISNYYSNTAVQDRILAAEQGTVDPFYLPENKNANNDK